MNEIRLKKTKISFAATPLLSTNGKEEFDTIDQWASRFARITVAGDVPPPTTFGIQWVKRPVKFTLRELVGAHLSFIPGAGACLIAKPTFRVGQGIADLAAFIDVNKIDMAFGCKICDKTGTPRGFVVSNSVMEHIMGGFNNRILVSDPWETELDPWLTNALRHRYIDATRFEILIENKPVETKPIEDKPKVKAKKSK